jgi:hypothetical protein
MGLVSHYHGAPDGLEGVRAAHEALDTVRHTLRTRARRSRTRSPRRVRSDAGMTLQSLFESSALDSVDLSTLRARLATGDVIQEIQYFACQPQAPHIAGGGGRPAQVLIFRATSSDEIKALYRDGRLLFETPLSVLSHGVACVDGAAQSALGTKRAGVVCVIANAKTGGVNRKTVLPSNIVVTRGDDEAGDEDV